MKKTKKERKKIPAERIVAGFVFLALAASAVFIIIAMILAPATDEEALPNQRLKSDYVLMLLQCLLGLFGMFIPSFVERKVNVDIPSYMIIMYTLFLYGAIYLGEVRNFYYVIPYWDTILHTFSGAMLAALGFSVITYLNKAERIPLNLSPAFVALFTFCFAVMVGVIWEMYEFFADGLLGLNMQKFMLEDGTELIGREALINTMVDLVVDVIGAFVISLVGYVSLKYKKGWVERLLFKKKKTRATEDGTDVQK